MIMPRSTMMVRSAMLTILAACCLCKVIMAEPHVVDHGKALMEWLKTTKNGFFHANLQIQPFQGDSSYYYSMVATEPIAQNEIILQIPRSMLVTPQTELEVGERVHHFYSNEEEEYPGTIRAIFPQEDGTLLYQIIDDDGDRQDDADAETDFEPLSYLCKTVQTLVKEMKLGDSSHLSPYINYLKSQPQGQLPAAWSEQGQDLFREITYEVAKEEQLLPPFAPFFHAQDFENDCRTFVDTPDFDLALHAYMMLLQRGWDQLMIPVFDMMSHGNGHWLNTKIVGSVHDPNLPVMVQASRNIEKGEEIYTTYNFCEDCDGRKLWYGTPELLRDYGFVEQYPQRWCFEDQDVIFDLEPENNEGEQLSLKFVEDHVLEPEHTPFFVEQLQRLEGLGETAFAVRDPNVADNEWGTLVQYRQDLITAIRTLLANSIDATSSCNEQSCNIAASRFHAFFEDDDQEELWDDFRPQTCHYGDSFGVPFWVFTEFIETPYQTIKYLDNPTYDPPDTCLMLEDTWQICTSYRPHYHEFGVHYPARFLDQVKRVVFVGGGDSMLLHDILKYSTLEKVVGLEIDQQVVRSSYRHFGTQPHFDNDKVEWWFGDASKTLLTVPKEYFGSFDLVLVDLSETVAALSVTKDLDIMETLTLLVKPDGILLKNEYEYFPHQRKLFQDVLHIHFYNTPGVCSQSMILCSNGIDFMRGDFHEHDGIDPLMKVLHEDDIRYSVSRDYQKNHTNPSTYCSNEENVLTEQDQSPGITMIVEAEQTTVKMDSPEAMKHIVEKTLKEHGFSVVTTMESNTGEFPVTVTILREGYVVARSWPGKNYCAYDLHLWSSFEKHDDAKVALVSAAGSSSSSSSAFRIVSGGMFGVSKWQHDEANRGPKLEPCSEANSIDTTPMTTSTAATTTRELAANDISIQIAVQESMGLVSEEEGEFVVAVICGREGSACHGIDAVKRSSRVADVIPVYGCANLAPGDELLEDAASRMLACENSIWKLLESKVSAQKAKKKVIRAIVLDSSAERTFVSVFQSLCKSQLNKKRFFAEWMLVVAPVIVKEQNWRIKFVNSFREQIFPKEPSFKSEIILNSTTTIATETPNEPTTSFLFSIASSGDILFFKHIVEFAERVETKTNIVADIDNVRGGDFIFQDPFVFKEKFDDSHFDQSDPLHQWESQNPLGLQVVMQLSQNQYLTITWEEIKKAFETNLALVLPDNENSLTQEIQSDKIGGEGGVLVSFWSKGHAVVVWDGRLHVDVNLFLYQEDFEFVDKLEENLTKEVQGLKRTLRDMHPRGTGRVVNFAKDLEGVTKPRWI